MSSFTRSALSLSGPGRGPGTGKCQWGRWQAVPSPADPQLTGLVGPCPGAENLRLHDQLELHPGAGEHWGGRLEAHAGTGVRSSPAAHPQLCVVAAVASCKAKAIGTFFSHGFYCSPQVKTVTKSSHGLLDVTVTSSVPGHKPAEKVIQDVDCLLWAVGREPNTEELCLDHVVRRQHVPSLLV